MMRSVIIRLLLVTMLSLIMIFDQSVIAQTRSNRSARSIQSTRLAKRSTDQATDRTVKRRVNRRAGNANSASNIPLPDWHQYSEIGRGTAVVFSPDVARPANRQLYQQLGFLYIETADWYHAIDQILKKNRHGGHIETVILETHGNWGHGLKLQAGKEPSNDRSYLSLGALQELLAGSGVQRCILTACNAGRLLRPSIYNTLDESELLPANYGVINASPGYNPQQSDVHLLRRKESQMEMLSTVSVDELPEAVSQQLGLRHHNDDFTVSDLFLQYVLRDPRLHLTDVGYVEAISKQSSLPAQSENLIKRFFASLAQVNKQSAQEPARQQIVGRPDRLDRSVDQ